MKKFYQLLPLLIIPIAIVFISNSTGSPGGKTGSSGDNGISCTQCHLGTSINADNWITTDIPGNGYIGGETYTITVTGMHTGVGKFGFEVTAEDELGNKTGSFALVNAVETKFTNGDQAVTHTSQGNTPTGDMKSWQAEWTAPEEIPGNIIFYAAVNAANGNGTTSGDQIYLTDLTVSADITGIAEGDNALRIYPNPSTGVVNFEIPAIREKTTVSVFNQNGQVVERFDMSNPFRQVNLHNLAKGIYFVNTGSGEMQKLVIR
ncbi:MAG: choice-of-anchor V domain-containing protein [Bacteroidota bacterium]